MLDETLCELLNIEDELAVRSKFCELLNKEVCYLFILIHHENKHIINYTSLLGENYKKIVHIDSKKISTHENVNDYNYLSNYRSFSAGSTILYRSNVLI